MIRSKTAGRAQKALSKPASSRRLIVRVELTPEAKARIVTASDHFGMTQIAALSRLVEWFAGQPEAVQHAVASDSAAPAAPELLRQVLEPMLRRDAARRRT